MSNREVCSVKFKIICYHTILHTKTKVYKFKDIKSALEKYIELCDEEKEFIDVRLYKGFTKITSCFMGNDYYKELKELLLKLKEIK